MTPVAKAQLVQSLAHQLGFDLVGVAPAAPLARAAYYRDWLAAGHAGTMRYLACNVQLRADPGQLLPGARTVICAAIGYRRADGYVRPADVGTDCGSGPSGAEPAGVVAQYARGRDYHVVLRDLLAELVRRLRAELDESFAARVFVDTGPLLERELAASAGLGWIGRNTCLLNAQVGSYLVLGEIVTTLELATAEPVAERCGACTRCLDACPTGALIAAHQLDATRCLSYLTIEYRGEIAPEFHGALGTRVYGCDICQQVCPYNARAPEGTQADLNIDLLPAQIDLVTLIRLRRGEYHRLTRATAAQRARQHMWRRNAAIAAGNVRHSTDKLRAALDEAAADPRGIVRTAAQASVARCRTFQPCNEGRAAASPRGGAVLDESQSRFSRMIGGTPNGVL